MDSKALEFIYDALPGRVVFGAGKLAAVAAEVEHLGAGKALVLSTPEQRGLAETVATQLGLQSAGVFDQARMHVPTEIVAAGLDAARAAGAGCTVAVGGGSTIGLAKAVALETGLPIIAIPTTYAGSEMTPIWGKTEAGVKRTGRDSRVLPRTVIYDPQLLVTLPDFITGPSGMNAIAHCVEAMYAEDQNPITSLLAEEGIRAFARSLTIATREPGNLRARADTLYGAWLAGAALGQVGMALHHKLCHTLGGSFDLPHAEVHSIVISHATAYNANSAPTEIARVAAALGANGAQAAGPALFELLNSVAKKTTLADLGMREADLDRAAELATQNPYFNPRPVTREGIRALLDDAYFGRQPGGGDS